MINQESTNGHCSVLSLLFPLKGHVEVLEDVNLFRGHHLLCNLTLLLLWFLRSHLFDAHTNRLEFLAFTFLKLPGVLFLNLLLLELHCCELLVLTPSVQYAHLILYDRLAIHTVNLLCQFKEVAHSVDMRFNFNELRGRIRLGRAFCSLLVAKLSDETDPVRNLLVNVVAHDSLRALRRLCLENALLIPDLRGAHLILSNRLQQATDLVIFLFLDLLILLAPLVCLLLVVLPLLDEGQIAFLELNEMVVELFRVAEG